MQAGDLFYQPGQVKVNFLDVDFPFLDFGNVQDIIDQEKQVFS
ncbi:MAG TPA: hypothetical protein VI583_14525 [Cyclobacteriaceae bacterium]|nr:hypothetical protein [Cyclobacteriaceae bacterium]